MTTRTYFDQELQKLQDDLIIFGSMVSEANEAGGLAPDRALQWTVEGRVGWGLVMAVVGRVRNQRLVVQHLIGRPWGPEG